MTLRSSHGGKVTSFLDSQRGGKSQGQGWIAAWRFGVAAAAPGLPVGYKQQQRANGVSALQEFNVHTSSSGMVDGALGTVGYNLEYTNYRGSRLMPAS